METRPFENRPFLWEFGSNISPMERYIMNLHDQVYDLQTQMTELKFHQTWMRRHPFLCEIPTKYIYMRYHLNGFLDELAAERAFLGSLEMDLIRFAVWKIVPLLDNDGGWEIRFCSQWHQWVDLEFFRESLKTLDTRLCLKTVSGFESLEMFIGYIEGWRPCMKDAWCRVYMDTEHQNIDVYQDYLAEHWGVESLCVWLREPLEK